MVDWTVEAFRKDHDRLGFHCGNDQLDYFLRQLVSQYEKRKLGKTYVAVPAGGKKVLGYYTLAAGAVSFQHLPVEVSQKLPKHPVPVVLLARLAVDKAHQGMRLGEGLLMDALQRALDLASSLGVHAVEVEAIDGHAVKFYKKYGFISLIDHPAHMFLPIATIAHALR